MAFGEQVQQQLMAFRLLPRLVAGSGQPDGTVGVLPAVLPDAWGVVADIAWVGEAVEGRGEQGCGLDLSVPELFQSGGHRLPGTVGVAVRGEGGEALCHGVQGALGIAVAAEGFSLVIVAPQIPLTVPSTLRLLDEVFG